MEEINRIDYNSNWKKMYFARNYTYLELLDWVHEHLSFTHEPISNRSKDPFRILESGIGKCQEFSILYIFSCLANNYEARLVIAKINGDHAWTEVKIDEKWVHIDPTEKIIDDPLMYYKKWNKKYYFIFTFENGRWRFITNKYNPLFKYLIIIFLLGFCIIIYLIHEREIIYKSLKTLIKKG